jgi:hypothetical protein
VITAHYFFLLIYSLIFLKSIFELSVNFFLFFSPSFSNDFPGDCWELFANDTFKAIDCLQRMALGFGVCCAHCSFLNKFVFQS